MSGLKTEMFTLEETEVLCVRSMPEKKNVWDHQQAFSFHRGKDSLGPNH